MVDSAEINELTAASALTGAGLVEVEQSGVTKSATDQTIADLGDGTILADYTFGADATEKEFTFAGGQTAIEIRMVLGNAVGSACNVSYAINGDTTSANYYSQRFGATNGTTMAASESTGNTPISMTVGGSAILTGVLLCGPDRPFMFMTRNEYDGVDQVSAVHYHYHYTGANPASFTSLKFTATQTNGIVAGSRIIIRKIA